MKHAFRAAVAALLVLTFMLGCMPLVYAENAPVNPLIEPQELQAVQTPQRYTNVLLLGIDFGFRNYRGSGSALKKTLEDCHTDAVMVAAINMTTGDVDLVSLPRDTLTYVPEVKGIYKLNGAFNCAETLEEGFKRISDAASWLLGGIRIDHYCAVDMAAMIALGDYIGGVDMELEMSYTGSSGKKYSKGYQHLDGVGITDYVRARRNATVNSHDIGRTNRQRQTMTAIFNKVKSNAGLIKSGWDYANSGEINFYTDMSLGKVLNLLNKVKSSDDIGSYVLNGTYRTAMDWNFTFTDQANRIEVLREVYGIEAEELPYVSYEYTKWLVAEGFRAVHYIGVANEIISFAKAKETLSAEQQDALAELEIRTDALRSAFSSAAESMSYEAREKMLGQRNLLHDAGNKAAEVLNYKGGQVTWGGWEYWYYNSFINEYEFSWQ